MRVILTHEQADFDAVASQLGAALLDEGALPVLPRRVNRNVRSFLALYGSELPFLEARDLPPGAVEAAALVDTQSLATLKGMSAATRVRVLDHHPLRPGLPPDWEVTIEQTGAVTTLLVEKLEERGPDLNTVQATLLLLGVYEDTGSLTYSTTTPRDVRAAAFLLEAGADLRTVARFLNPPLSPEQRVIYEQLAANAHTHQIHGYHVVIACGDATGTAEEVSSLTHKLRDLLDPDALFVLATTADGTRLVARSAVDDIDVSAVAAHFGGGGHDRAAAALVRAAERAPGPETLAALEAELLQTLPRYILPSVTVAQIMSGRPRLLSPATPVHEAARLMQKYGYEGFPVVDEGRVVGLLTRRAVDRALAHKLNLTAASLMEAGEVAVRPSDSVQHLQAVMTDTGWGQVPVLDEAGKIIGIVTRTDLLKTLAPRPPSDGRTRNLSARLEQALPPDRLTLLKAVIEAAAGLNAALYIVGGFVRDLLLDRPGLDFDLVVEGDAIALAREMAHRYGGRVTGHSRFGTAKWFLDGHLKASRLRVRDRANLPEFLDFISARTEFYEQPTALPTVERGSIKLDLHRRDFTINTLALRLDGRRYGELLDYWGGLADLRAGLVRVLHSLSFVDDPTRMLRAVRFEQRFGFRIETRTLQLMGEARSLLEKLTPERVGHELDLILDEPAAVVMLSRLEELGLLKAIHPALPWDDALKSLLASGLEQAPPAEWGALPALRQVPFRRGLGYLLWLADLPGDKIHAACTRLRLPVSLRAALLAARDLRADLPGLVAAKPSAVAARLEDVPPMSIFAVWLGAAPDQRLVLDSYMVNWRRVKPSITGHTLKERGLAPGPKYQKILRRLREAWLDGEVKSQNDEIALLNDLLSNKV